MKLLAFLLLTLSVSAHADFSGHWYDAEHPGHGIQIDADSGFGHAVTWYLYRKDGSTAFLTAGETCAEFPCVVALHEPSAGFMGRGEFDLGDPVGLVELSFSDGKLLADYNLISWIEECRGASPGGIIFHRCIGEIEFSRLAD